jgi:hypothetical protein
MSAPLRMIRLRQRRLKQAHREAAPPHRFMTYRIEEIPIGAARLWELIQASANDEYGATRI